MPLRSHVADLQYNLVGDLLLDVQVVIFHVGRFDIPVEGENIALRTAGAVWYSINGYPRLNRPVERQGERCLLDGVGSNIVICRPGGVKRRVWQVAQEHVLREGVKKHSVAAANDRLAVSENVPGDAGAGCKVLVVGIVEFGQSTGHAHLDELAN